MSLRYEPSSKALHISAKQLFACRCTIRQRGRTCPSGSRSRECSTATAFSARPRASSSSFRFTLISHTVLLKSFCRSQFPHKFVNLFFILVIVKGKLTDLWGSSLLQSGFQNTLCEMNSVPRRAFPFRGGPVCPAPGLFVLRWACLSRGGPFLTGKRVKAR